MNKILENQNQINNILTNLTYENKGLIEKQEILPKELKRFNSLLYFFISLLFIFVVVVIFVYIIKLVCKMKFKKRSFDKSFSKNLLKAINHLM